MTRDNKPKTDSDQSRWPQVRNSPAMLRSIERSKELYPEGFKWKNMVSNVRSTENIDS